MKKIDRRVQKTNQALKVAFRQLARTTSYRDITVKSLTEMAKINRKTFYLHYKSIDDFSNTVADGVSEKILNLITDKPLKISLSEPGYIFDRVSDFFQQSWDFYTFTMTSFDYSFLSQKIEDNVIAGFTKEIEKEFDISKLDANICANLLSHNTLMMFRLYRSNQFGLSISECRERLIKLNDSCLNSFSALSRTSLE